jgi:hypothetical protein
MHPLRCAVPHHAGKEKLLITETPATQHAVRVVKLERHEQRLARASAHIALAVRGGKTHAVNTHSVGNAVEFALRFRANMRLTILSTSSSAVPPKGVDAYRTFFQPYL